MIERTPQENMEKTRQDLLQTLMEQMFSIMKQVHHGVLSQGHLLSPPQAQLLFIVADHKEEGISVKELAKTTNVTSGAITQFIDTLVKKDLVKREEDPNDRRVLRLKLTELARNQLQYFRKDYLASATRTFDFLSNDEINELIKLLTKVSSCPNLKEFKR